MNKILMCFLSLMMLTKSMAIEDPIQKGPTIGRLLKVATLTMVLINIGTATSETPAEEYVNKPYLPISCKCLCKIPLDFADKLVQAYEIEYPAVGGTTNSLVIERAKRWNSKPCFEKCLTGCAYPVVTPAPESQSPGKS